MSKISRGTGERARRRCLFGLGAHSLATAALFMLAAVAVSPLPFIIGASGYPYLVIVIAADVTLLYGIVLSRSAPGRASTVIKYGMLVVLLAYVVGGI